MPHAGTQGRSLHLLKRRQTAREASLKWAEWASQVLKEQLAARPETAASRHRVLCCLSQEPHTEIMEEMILIMIVAEQPIRHV